MRRVILIVFGLVCLYAAGGLAENPRNVMPANCKDKQQIQMLSAGEPIAGDPDKVTCTVTYWACGQRFAQSQAAPNQPGACERFTNLVRGKLGGEACCDCFPKCAAGDTVRRKPPAPVSETTQPSKADCCGKLEQLEEQVRQLEARVKALEERLSVVKPR